MRLPGNSRSPGTENPASGPSGWMFNREEPWDAPLQVGRWKFLESFGGSVSGAGVEGPAGVTGGDPGWGGMSGTGSAASTDLPCLWRARLGAASGVRLLEKGDLPAGMPGRWARSAGAVAGSVSPALGTGDRPRKERETGKKWRDRGGGNGAPSCPSHPAGSVSHPSAGVPMSQHGTGVAMSQRGTGVPVCHPGERPRAPGWPRGCAVSQRRSSSRGAPRLGWARVAGDW